MTNTHFFAFFICLLPFQVALAAEQTITSAGSSAAAPIYKSWASEYQKATGVNLSYDPIGSSAGVKKVSARETDFGASDVALSATELTKHGLVLFPIAITGIAPVVNLPKTGDGQVRLNGEVLARIFMGDVTQWSAAEISELNPGVSLPDLPIKVIVRSDGSGTTYNFADYLAKVSPAWREKNGVKSSYAWPASFVTAKGSDGVVKAVKEVVGSIGYVDYGYVKDNKLSTVQLRNSEGEFIKPAIGGFRTALLNSDWVSKGIFSATLTNTPGKGAWPVTMGTFALMPQNTEKPEQTQRALKFFVWAFMNGDKLVHDNNFVRLPDRVQAAAFKTIASIKDKAGNLIGLASLGSASPAQ